jgi:hypothetical protein
VDTEKVIQIFEKDILPQLTENKDSYNLNLLTAHREETIIKEFKDLSSRLQTFLTRQEQIISYQKRGMIFQTKFKIIPYRFQIEDIKAYINFIEYDNGLQWITVNKDKGEDTHICMPEWVRIEEDLFKQLGRIVGILSARWGSHVNR